MVEPDYAWVRITQFQERTVEDFAQKVGDLLQANPQMKGMVLDLRNDPGGLLDAATRFRSLLTRKCDRGVHQGADRKQQFGLQSTLARLSARPAGQRPDSEFALETQNHPASGTGQ